GPSLATALQRRRGRRAADGRGRGRPDRRPARGAGRRHRHRPAGRPGLHRHRAPSEAGPPVSAPDPRPASAPSTLGRVVAVRRRRTRRTLLTGGVRAAAILAMFCLSLMVGRTYYPPADVLAVLLGQDVPGASFTVGTLRLPRAVLAVLAGACFGLGGVTFQT